MTKDYTLSEIITIETNGVIGLNYKLRPEIYAMLVKYRSLKYETDIPIADVISDILNDFLIEKLSRPTGWKKLKPLDTFDIELKAK